MRTVDELVSREMGRDFGWTGDLRRYGLCDVVYHDCAVRVAVVHWRKGFIAFLTSRIPYFKLDGRCFIEGNGLCKESRSNLSSSQ